MSCLALVDSKVRTMLRNKIANNLVNRARNNQPIDLAEYVREIYNFFKEKGAEESLAIDAARIVPILLDQIMALNVQVTSELKKANPKIRHEVLDLSDQFEANVEAVRELIGLKETPAPLIEAIQAEVSTPIKEEEIPAQLSIPYNSIAHGAFRTFGVEVVQYKDPSKPGYMEPKPEFKHAYTVMRAIESALQEQIKSRGISDSSNMTYPGVDGGIYLMVKSAPYEGLAVVITDKHGIPIKFDADGKAGEGQTVSYTVATDPLRNSSGQIITDQKEFSEYKNKLTNPGARYAAQGAFDNIQVTIQKMIQAKNPENRKLTPEQEKKAKAEAVKAIESEYAIQKQMRDYIHKNPGAFVMASINGYSKGIVNKNTWTQTDLSSVDFTGTIFRPIVETKEQTEGSLLKQGAVYFQYPGVDEPIAALGKPFIQRPELLDKIVSLFVEDIYSTATGKTIRISIEERNSLIEQYLYTSDIKYLSNEVGGGRRNWINSDGSLTLKVGGQEFRIKFDDTTASKATRDKAADAIRKELSKPFIKADTKGFPIDKSLNSKTKIKEAQEQGANVVYAKPGQTFQQAVKEGTITPNTIFVTLKPSTKRPGETDVDNAYRVYYPTVSAKNNLLNKDYADVTLTQEDGKTFMKSTKKDYNQYIIDNFFTPAAVGEDGKIKTVNPFIAFAPLPTEMTKFVADLKQNEPVGVHPAYKGKVIFATPGSGKSTVASATEDVIDADQLLLGEIAILSPEFPIDKSIHPGLNILSYFKYSKNPDQIYTNVRAKMKDLTAQGKTIVTGSSRFIADSDFVFIQTNPDILKSRPGYKTDEISIAKTAGKSITKINQYMDSVLSKAPQDVVIVKEEKPAKPETPPITPLTQPNVSSMTEEEIMKALLNKKLEKGAKAKAANLRSTAEQMKAAEEWYSKSPLAVHFPFKTLLGAVNSSTGGPAAQWTIHGVTLFHYYSPDGKLDLSKSGDFTDLYHEAWHGFTQTFLSPEQRENMYNELRKKSGSFKDFRGNYVTFKDANWEQLEEYLAEDFRAYAMSGGKTAPQSPVRNSIFRRILDFLKKLFTGTKTSDVIQNPLGVPMIQELYQKLYTGNLAEYNFDVNNRNKTIGALNHAMLASDPESPVKELGFDDANLLVNTIDSIISTKVNILNASREDSDMTAQFTRDPKYIKYAYALAKIELEKKVLKNLEAKLQTAQTEYEKKLIEQDIALIKWAVSNFGNIDNISENARSGKGLIAYHLEKSKYLTAEDKEALTDEDIDETKVVTKASDLHSQAGNEKSQLELASPEVQQLLRSIHKYDDNGKPVMNRLGVQELTDHYHMMNKLARVLGDSMSMPVMYDRLRAAASESGSTVDPTIQDLITKLGPPNTNSDVSKKLWINFWSAFNMANIRLVQMNIEHDKGEYSVRIGNSNTHSHKVGMFWKNLFLTQPNSKFIKRGKDNNNYLDLVDVINEFSDGDKLRKDSEFEFFRAIGINLSDKKAIRHGLTLAGGNTGAAAQIFKRLKRLVSERNILKLTSLDDVFREYKTDGKFPAITSENVHFTALRELETKNSDYANNYMVTNAEGNTQFEQSLHNTISIMVATLNEVESYAQLMSIPHMQYLNVENNPFAAASIWLNSMFDMRNYVKGDAVKTGPKRTTGGLASTPVKINMSNLSGVQLIDENGDQGISSASSDEFTKLILDFHLTTVAGKPELMRHADKSTSFSIWLNNITGGSSDNKSYVDTIRLIKDHDGNIGGYAHVVDILERYIDAELQRVKELRAMSEDKDLVYDANYLAQGQNFIIFEDILSKPIRDILVKYNSINEAVTENQELGMAIKQQIVQYFENQTKEVKTLMNKAEFIDKSLITTTSIMANKGVSGKPIGNADIKDGLVRSFVVNSWIHNLESMSMIYGDLAQYNLAKEEFHKRNAGAGSTGNLFASDKATIDYVNNKGRLYAKSLGLTEKKLADSGEFDSAVLADNEIPSVDYKVYLDAIRESLINKNNKISDPKKRLSKEDIEKKALAAAKAYTENNEGDAQGWITFDFYRSLSILEGKWSAKQERMYNDIIAGKPVDAATATEFFPTRKFQYWGPLVVGDNLPLNAFHKFSLFPMIPSIVGDKNLYKDRLTNLGLLQEKMIKEGVDYSLFKSGSKISTLTKIENGKAIQDKFYSDGEQHTFAEKGTFTKNTIFLQFLKDQLEIAPYFKEQVTFPTQMRKLIENGLMEGGVPTDFMADKDLTIRQKAWAQLPEDKRLESKRYQKLKEYEADIEALTALRKKELETEASIQRDPQGNVIMTDKLAEFIVKELKRQDLAEHEISFLKEINGKLSKDLSLSLSAEKIEKVLNSIVVRRLVKQKFNGEGLIQVSGAGFESALRGKLTEEEKAKYGTNGLPFYRRDIDSRQVSIQMQPDNISKILSGAKTTTTRSESQAKQIGLLPGQSGVVMFNGKKFIVTARGPQTIQEAGGKERMISSEAVVSENDFKYQQTKYWVNGTGQLWVYDIKPYSSKTQAMKVKIALQGDFLNLLDLNHIDGQPIATRERLNQMLKNETWLSIGDHRKMISIIGPRIPVQGLNSMEFAEVYEFLPFEAGNIVVLPTEIVAKAGSDFDIDKLTFLMPNISSGVNFEYWSTEAGKKKLAELRKLNPEMTIEFSEENVASVIANRKSKDKTQIDKDVLRALAEVSQKDVKYVTGRSAEGLENKILDNMRSILELEENFVDLIRPNGTDIVKEGLADDIGQYVMEFDPRTVEYTDKKGKKANRIPGTKVFEVRYNLYKHASNNIGKQTLGLGAVDNTYNSLFNRIGARMNHSYRGRAIEKRLEILLPHNTLKDDKDRDVISLSHIMDAKGENTISDVISQLMNGWVDIAKDAWIFNIQGNKEVAPVLLFMVQAGVPIKQAVYMAANPMVRAYINEQKLAKSTFAGPLGKSPGNWRYYRNQARKIILGSPKYGINIDTKDLENANLLEVAQYEKTLVLTNITAREFFNPDKVETNLLDRVKAFSKGQKEEGFKESEFYTDEDRAVFLHYLELEEMAKSMTAIKTKTNVDTARSNTLFEAQSRLEMIQELKNDAKFPDWMIDKLIGDPERGIKGESPISSFNVQGFQVKLWKDFFKLRNNEAINEFILEKMREPGFGDDVDATWGDAEKLINQFRNGVVPFVFQNYMRQFDIENIKDYKGLGVNTSYDVKKVPSLSHGVFVKEGVIYLDKVQLKRDFQTLGTKAFTGFKGARLNPAAFKTAGSYYSFVFERELLRSMYSGTEGWKLLQDRVDVQDKLRIYKDQMTDKTQAQIDALVYEETLRDMALDNTFNMWKLFKSKNSTADQLIQIQLKYPELASQYALINNLAPSIREIGGDRTANIMLTDIMLDADKINLFNQNLRELSDPSRIKLSTDNAIEIQRVSEFFKNLSIYSFLQSGMNTTGMFSLVRVVPQDRFTGQIIPYAADFMSNINELTLQRYWNMFIHASKSKKLRSRMRDYTLPDFNPKRDKELAKKKDSHNTIKKMAAGDIQDRNRFATDNSGNTLYYANPSLNQEGIPVTGVTQSQAKALVENNPDKVFVINGATESMKSADKDEKSLINAKSETGNVVPFPTKKTFGFTGYELKDVTAEEAQTIQPVEEKQGIPQAPAILMDNFKYYGAMYEIKVENGIAVEVVDYKGKQAAENKILEAYNKNPNVDPQNGKPFRTDIVMEGPGYIVKMEGAKPVIIKKQTVVPKGSKSTNLPIFETEDKIFLMNDGQQAAYDHIKSFVLERLSQRLSAADSPNTVEFNTPMTKEFSGIIPQGMWDNMIGLVGRGGVGKTTVIKKVLEDIKAEYRKGVNITYAAPTHNAVTMLQEALGIDSERTEGVQTLASLVARNQTFNSKDKESTDKGTGEDGLFLLKEEAYKQRLNYQPAISDANIIVIDEASMVDSQFIKDLLFRFHTEAKERGMRRMPIFIYMGDYRQLPPVDTTAGEKKPFREGIISATLFADKNKTKFSELTQVMRSDNELFHQVFDTVGNQITEQRKDVDAGGSAKNFDFTPYDALTNKSTENMLVIQEKEVDQMIEDYVDVLSKTDNPYEMFWTHYNNINNAKTQDLFNRIRSAYFKKIGVEMPTGMYKGKGGTRYDIGVGDYVQSTFTLPVKTKEDSSLDINAGIIKPTARFKVLDIIAEDASLSRLNSDLYRYLGENLTIPVKKIILFNRQGEKRVVSFPAVRGIINTVGYDAATRSQILSVTDKSGRVHELRIPYAKWKEGMNEILQLNMTFEDMFLPSYIGSTHTVQGASIKKIIVGDYNIRLNAPHISLRDMESSLYTALTRTAEKLIIIKPNFVPIENNQEVFQLNTIESAPETKQEAEIVGSEGAPKTVQPATKEDPLPSINGMTVDPRIKAQIDSTIQSLLEYKNNGYDLAFPGTGLGQYMIGADDLTGILDPAKAPVAPATFVYLSQQLFKHFGYVNPNLEKALYNQGEINVVQQGAPVTDEEVQQQLDFFDKNCGA